MPSVCPTPFNISNAYPIPAPSSHSGTYLISCLHPILAPCPTACPLLTLGMPHSRCSTPALLHLLPAPCPTATPSKPPHSCLRPLPPPRLHWHGPIPASSSPLTSTCGFHVADAAHRGVTMPSVCPTPFNISNAYPIPAPASDWEFHVADAARRGVTMPPVCPTPFNISNAYSIPAPSSHSGIPRSRCRTPALPPPYTGAMSHCHPE